MTTIAGRASITPQAVGELVDDLERLSYVVRRPDPNDRGDALIGLDPLSELSRSCAGEYSPFVLTRFDESCGVRGS